MQVRVLMQSPLCQQLHRLPVSSHIQYKLCMMMHDVYHSKAPGYLADLYIRCGDTRLGSSSRDDFVVQRTRLRLAEKSFSVAGPRAWNSLTSHIRTLVSRDSFSRHLDIFSSSPTTFSDLFLFTLLC